MMSGHREEVHHKTTSSDFNVTVARSFPDKMAFFFDAQPQPHEPLSREALETNNEYNSAFDH